MQRLAVVYFPKINLDKVNSFREKYDPKWHIIPPHITLVSPISDVTEKQLTKHVENIAEDIQPFSIHLIGLTKTSDGCLFLLVKEGKEKIANLHHRLYSGILDSYIPTDLPFIPHITLGNFGTEESALYAEAEKANFDITCAFGEMSIIKGDGVSPAKIVRTIDIHN